MAGDRIISTGERKVRVLLADDEQDLLKLMQLTLLSDGYEVLVSENGENIDTIIEENRPDIILLDIRMKNNDGREICRRIKENPSTSDIKVILFSANDNLTSIEKHCGADASLPKPYDKKLAKQTFEKVLK